MPKEKPDIKNLSNNLKQLSKITEWFENQEDIDIEEGLKKVKEAAVLIKASKERLKTIENEFKEIKKEIDIEEDEEESNNDEDDNEEENKVDPKDIPF
ncbi:exodeoxyribonuclease VII small subunit [Patescibacteria group bacterium]|nr:exodeoxyribonuclease VII small subunit [Patescibacteria group bacterium]